MQIQLDSFRLQDIWGTFGSANNLICLKYTVWKADEVVSE